MISTIYFENRTRELHRELARTRQSASHRPPGLRPTSYDTNLWKKTSYLCRLT